MLSATDNRKLTQTGPDTPMGRTFRNYWMPALLSRELPHPDCPPVRLKLLGEDFRRISRFCTGTVGIIEPRCPHRGAESVLRTKRSMWVALHLPWLEI